MKVLIRALPELAKPPPPPPNSGTLVLFFPADKNDVYLYRDYYLVEKKDQKIQARVNPPPHFQAMPELKPSFSIDVFPLHKYNLC